MPHEVHVWLGGLSFNMDTVTLGVNHFYKSYVDLSS